MARLTPITSKDQVAPEHQAIVDGIVASHGPLQGPYTMFLHCPELDKERLHMCPPLVDHWIATCCWHHA